MSSAYNSILDVKESCVQIGLINKMKSKGPRMEPWGTPDNTLDKLEWLPLTSNHSLKSVSQITT